VAYTQTACFHPALSCEAASIFFRLCLKPSNHSSCSRYLFLRQPPSLWLYSVQFSACFVTLSSLLLNTYHSTPIFFLANPAWRFSSHTKKNSKWQNIFRTRSPPRQQSADWKWGIDSVQCWSLRDTLRHIQRASCDPLLTVTQSTTNYYSPVSKLFRQTTHHSQKPLNF